MNKKLIIMRRSIYFIAALIVVSCQSEKATTGITKTNLFEKPIKDVDVPLQKHIVNSENGDTIYLANNTRIIIPNNAFVDSIGNPITGEVEIDFQEYHTEAEVILSGIPMQYDSAGTTYTLETDGMFKINGTQNNKKVEIAPNKDLRVKTQSYKEDTPCFNYYTQNKDGDWKYEETKNRTLNTEAIVENEFKKIKQLDENTIGLDLRINTEKYTELKDFKNITWIYDGNQPDTINHKLLSKIRWNDIELQKTDKSVYSYSIVGTHKKHQFTMPITLAFTDNELDIVKSNIEHIVKERKIDYAKLKQQYEREAVINRFGIHNWDRCVKSEMIVMNTQFSGNHAIKHFFVVNKNDNYNFVNSYNYDINNQVKFLKNGKYIIIAFLEEGGKISYALNDQLKGNDQRQLTVHLNEKTATLKKPSDLQKIIESI